MATNHNNPTNHNSPPTDHNFHIEPLITNIERDTLQNDLYRRVIHTGVYMQVVLMDIPSKKTIPMEVHRGDQFVRIEKGEGIVTINGITYPISDGTSISIPSGSYHYFENTGNKPLKLYTIYSPPEHSPTLMEIMNSNGNVIAINK